MIIIDFEILLWYTRTILMKSGSYQKNIKIRLGEIRMNTVENHLIYKIASLISDNDSDVIDELRQCIMDTSNYYSNHLAQYDERGMVYDDGEEEEITDIQWIGMVDILIKNKYACECDWKADLTDEFLFNMEQIKGIKSNNLQLKEEWFDEGESITEWCEVIDEKWRTQNMCVAAIDIDSDSYVMFPCNMDILSILNEYAGELDFQIILACDV